MNESEQAMKYAAAVLDRANADPDDDLAVLARQFVRAQEERDDWQSRHAALMQHMATAQARIATLEKALLKSCSDHLEYLTCQPTCDSYGHAENCAVANPRIEYDRLTARVQVLEEALKSITEMKQTDLKAKLKEGDHLKIIAALSRLFNDSRDIAQQALTPAKEQGT